MADRPAVTPADIAAVAGDWAAVGRDMQTAVKQVLVDSGFRYRVGAHYGIHVYEVMPDGDDRPVATASTPEDARRIVDALNAVEARPPQP